MNDMNDNSNKIKETDDIENIDILIENKYLQMRGLTSYKNINNTKLKDLARQKVLSATKDKDKDLEITSLFSDRKEIVLGKKLLAKYLRDYTPSSVSDKNNLRHLIYLEMIQVRLQDKMNEVNEKTNAIPLTMIDSVHKNLREINDLKLKLGLVGEKRDETKSDVYKMWELLKDKFKRWREENQGSRTIVCPHCGKMVMLKIRTAAWEAVKHPYFKDRILANKYLINLYSKGRIDRVDVAHILECSEDYVEWLIEKWTKIVSGEIGKADEASSEAAEEVLDEESGVERKINVKEVDENNNMLISEAKQKRDNRCPECETGYLYCKITDNGTGLWEEHCTDCEYHKIHVNRRAQQIEIDFPERRNDISSTASKEISKE